MWGLMLRIRGAQVDAAVPDWLLNADATYAAIAQVRRAANEMAIRPEAYGFDHTATYSVLFQTWDRALSDIRSVAFGRSRTAPPTVGLLPDPYFVKSRGYSALRRGSAFFPRWATRSDVVVWRGSVTGGGPIAGPEDLPRVQLALACRDRPDTDVGLIGVHATTNVLPPGAIDDFIASRGLLRDRWLVTDFARYKFAFDIDGHANAWGLLEKLIVGCCVLKIESPFEQWYYDRLLPWRHFVPVKADLSDLPEVIAWCREHEAQCEWIAGNGARLAAALTLERDLPRSCGTLLAAADAQPADSCSRARSRDADAALPLLAGDAVLRAESVGDLDQAIASYAQLIDIGSDGGRGEALILRHDLLRQRGEFAEALSDLQAAVANDPANDEASLRLGQSLASVGRDLAAIPYFEQALAAAPDRAEVRISLAGSCLKLGWIDRAFWTVRKAPEDLPGWWADVRNQAVETYTARRAAMLAVLAGRRAGGELMPDRRWALAVGLASLGRLKLAWRLCNEVMAEATDVTEPVELASRIIARREGPAAAYRFLDETIPKAAGLPRFSMLRASLLFELADYHQSLEALSSSPASGDDASRARRIAAYCLIFLGRRRALLEHCRRWMELAAGDMLPAELVCAAQPAPAMTPPRPRYPPMAVGIVQFWHDKNIPDDVQAVMDTWADHHPGLRPRVHCLDSARAFLIAEYDTATATAFDACRDPAGKAGLFRLAWLHRKGGVWIDVDQRCTRSVLGTLEVAAAADIAVVRSGYINGFLESSFLGARAGSRPVEMALRRATETILGAADRGERLSNWTAVGAGLLTRVVAQHLCESDAPEKTLLVPPFAYRSYAMTTDALSYRAHRPAASDALP